MPTNLPIRMVTESMSRRFEDITTNVKLNVSSILDFYIYHSTK